jgi:3-oxoadipate enol-lactonase
MTAGHRIVTEARVETARLGLFHILTAPTAPSAHRVLYLGGSSHDLRFKRAFLSSALPERAHVASYEPRGLGRSDRPEGAWTMADYAQDAAAFLDALGWESAYVVGESFGGMTALHLAVLAPQRVTALALMSATAGGAGGASVDISCYLDMPRADPIEAWMVLQDSALLRLKYDDPERFAQLKAARLEADRAFADPSVHSGGYGRLLEARRGHDAWARLGEITVPVTVMAGARDGQAPPEAQRAMAERLPRARFLSYDGGHGFGFTSPEPVEMLCQTWFPEKEAAQ